MNKKLTALAALAVTVAAQNAHATILGSGVTAGMTLQIGCTAPAAGGATVYSVDANVVDSTGASNTLPLPTGVAAGNNCTYALNQLLQVTSLTSTATGRWVNAGNLNTTTIGAGATPVNITIPGSGYSLQAYTLVAQ